MRVLKGRKSRAIVLMLVLLSLVLSLPIPAYAAEYTRLGVLVSVADGTGQALNTLKVSAVEGELRGGDVVFIRLPEDFVFNGGDWSYGAVGASVYYGDYDDGCYIYIPWDEENGLNLDTNTGGNPVPTNILTVDQLKDNEIRIRVNDDVPGFPSMTEDSYFFIYLEDVDIPGGFRGAISLSFEAPGGSGFGAGEVAGGRVGRLKPVEEEPVNPPSSEDPQNGPQPGDDNTTGEEPSGEQGKNLNVVFTVGSKTFTINGQAQSMDAAPYIKNGRTYLPMRYIAQALGISGSDIAWENGTASFTASGKTVSVKIGSKTMTVNGEAVPIDAPPEILNGRTMLPVKWIAAAFDVNVNWDAATQQVTIK